MLAQAASNVANLQQLGAQGAITWDIEGEQYPRTTSYVCAPDQISKIAPEMETVVSDMASPYAGMKLDDAYFKTMTDSGFRVGVCVRPQHFTAYPDGTASQVSLPDNQVASELIRKMKFAHDRWGATLFYVDSSVDANGGNLDPSLFQQVAAALPNSLIVPEESTPKYYAYTAPFQSFLFHTDLGTPIDVFNYYPNAFSVNLVNDVDPAKLLQHRQQLTDSVRRGDILMVHADYWQDNNSTVVQIYQDANNISPGQPTPNALTPTPPIAAPLITPKSGPQQQPIPSSPVSIASPSGGPSGNPVALTFPLSAQTLAGPVTITASIGRTLSSAGSHLLVDGVEVGTQTVTSPPYIYTVDTGTLNAGPHTLQVWALDIDNNPLLSNPVPISVSP